MNEYCKQFSIVRMHTLFFSNFMNTSTKHFISLFGIIKYPPFSCWKTPPSLVWNEKKIKNLEPTTKISQWWHLMISLELLFMSSSKYSNIWGFLVTFPVSMPFVKKNYFVNTAVHLSVKPNIRADDNSKIIYSEYFAWFVGCQQLVH